MGSYPTLLHDLSAGCFLTSFVESNLSKIVTCDSNITEQNAWEVIIIIKTQGRWLALLHPKCILKIKLFNLLVGWGLGHSIFYDVCLEQDNYHWKIILYLLYFLSSGPLDREALVGDFFCTWQYFWVASFSAPSLVCIRQKRNPGN